MRDNLNFSSEQIDRIGSVVQWRSLQAGEVVNEPSHPDVPLFISSRFARTTTPSGHGPHLSSATLLIKVHRNCLMFLRATSSRNM
jgi:hypothetical protein